MSDLQSYKAGKRGARCAFRTASEDPLYVPAGGPVTLATSKHSDKTIDLIKTIHTHDIRSVGLFQYVD